MKIVLSVVLALVLIGCSEDAQKEAKAAVAPEVAKTVEKVAVVKAVVEKKVAESKEAVVAKTEEVVTKTVEKAQEVTDSAVKATTEAVDAASDKVEAIVSSTTGKALYAKCAGCHGQNGEKKALGKSQVIQAWSAAKTADALHGYANGTYGGAMKGIMIGQAKGLSKSDIALLSEYISTL